MPRGAEVRLYDNAGNPSASVSGLKVAWFDTPDVTDFGDVAPFVTTVSTDADGWLRLNLENVSGLPIGDDGFLLVYKPDQTNHEDSLVFASKITVSDVTGGTVVSADTWERPSDWLELPALVDGDQKFVGLLAVFEQNSNFVALSCQGAYTVDWGDGTTQNFGSGVQAERNIQWADVSPSTLTSEGFRQVIITVTMQQGQTMTSFSLQRKHTQSGLPSVPNVAWLDVAINGSSLTSLAIRQASSVVTLNQLHRVQLRQNNVANLSNLLRDLPNLVSVDLNTAAGTNFNNMLANCFSIQRIPLLNTAAATNLSSMLSSCRRLITIPLLNTAACTNFQSMFNSCFALKAIPLLNTAAGTNFQTMFAFVRNLKTIPPLNTAAGTNFQAMFDNCSALQTIPALNTAAGTNFSSMFNGCSSLRTIPLLNTAAGTTFANMFNGCSALQTVPTLNTAAGTTFTDMFLGCTSLSKGRLEGTTRSISYVNLMLSASALNDIYTGLGTAAGAQTINVTGNWGTATDDPSIATAKGWTVTG